MKKEELEVFRTCEGVTTGPTSSVWHGLRGRAHQRGLTLRPSCFNCHGQESRLALSSPITPSATLAHILSLNISAWLPLPQICLALALCVAKKSQTCGVTKPLIPVFVTVVEAWIFITVTKWLIKNTWHFYPKPCCLPLVRMSLTLAGAAVFISTPRYVTMEKLNFL